MRWAAAVGLLPVLLIGCTFPNLCGDSGDRQLSWKQTLDPEGGHWGPAGYLDGGLRQYPRPGFEGRSALTEVVWDGGSGHGDVILEFHVSSPTLVIQGSADRDQMRADGESFMDNLTTMDFIVRRQLLDRWEEVVATQKGDHFYGAVPIETDVHLREDRIATLAAWPEISDAYPSGHGLMPDGWGAHWAFDSLQMGADVSGDLHLDLRTYRDVRHPEDMTVAVTVLHHYKPVSTAVAKRAVQEAFPTWNITEPPSFDHLRSSVSCSM
jgi:hypothetical protein